MIYSSFGKTPTIWSQLPLLWKILTLSVIFLYILAFAITWIGAIMGYLGYWFPILLTPATFGACLLIGSMLLERRRL